MTLDRAYVFFVLKSRFSQAPTLSIRNCNPGRTKRRPAENCNSHLMRDLMCLQMRDPRNHFENVRGLHVEGRKSVDHFPSF